MITAPDKLSLEGAFKETSSPVVNSIEGHTVGNKQSSEAFTHNLGAVILRQQRKSIFNSH
jgi:hypothetical protein